MTRTLKLNALNVYFELLYSFDVQKSLFQGRSVLVDFNVFNQTPTSVLETPTAGVQKVSTYIFHSYLLKQIKANTLWFNSIQYWVKL